MAVPRLLHPGAPSRCAPLPVPHPRRETLPMAWHPPGAFLPPDAPGMQRRPARRSLGIPGPAGGRCLGTAGGPRPHRAGRRQRLAPPGRRAGRRLRKPPPGVLAAGRIRLPRVLELPPPGDGRGAAPGRSDGGIPCPRPGQARPDCGRERGRPGDDGHRPHLLRNPGAALGGGVHPHPKGPPASRDCILGEGDSSGNGGGVDPGGDGGACNPVFGLDKLRLLLGAGAQNLGFPEPAAVAPPRRLPAGLRVPRSPGPVGGEKGASFSSGAFGFQNPQPPLGGGVGGPGLCAREPPAPPSGRGTGALGLAGRRRA